MCSYEERKLFKFRTVSLSESFIKITSHLSNWYWRKQTRGPKRSQNYKQILRAHEQPTVFNAVHCRYLGTGRVGWRAGYYVKFKHEIRLRRKKNTSHLIILFMREGCIFLPLSKKLTILETSFQYFIIYTLFYILLLNILLFIMMLNRSHDLKFHCALSYLFMKYSPLTPQIILPMRYLQITLKCWSCEIKQWEFLHWTILSS